MHTSFLTSLLPAGIKNLVKLTGLRPAKVSINFQSGPTTVCGAWHCDVVTLTGKLQGEKVTHWTGSDGESNTRVEKEFTAPVAQGTKGHGKRKSSVTVTIGNLGELAPTEAVTSPAALEILWRAAHSVAPVLNTTVERVTFVEPGPFTRADITKTTETDRKVILERNPDGSETEVVSAHPRMTITTPAINPQVEFLTGLGIE